MHRSYVISNVKLHVSTLCTDHYQAPYVYDNEMGGACGAYGGGEVRGVHRVLVRKPDGKRPLGESQT